MIAQAKDAERVQQLNVLGETRRQLAVGRVQARELNLSLGAIRVVREHQQLAQLLLGEVAILTVALGGEHLARQADLEHLLAVDLLFDGTARHEAIHDDVALLAQAVGTIDRLVVEVVPRRIKDDDAVGARERDADAAALRRQQEARDALVRVEAVDQLLSIVNVRDRAVDTHESHSQPLGRQHALHNVEHARRL